MDVNSTVRIALSSTIRLEADAVGHPPTDLATLRRWSDRERGLRPESVSALQLRAQIAMYLPSLFDLLEQTPLVRPEPEPPRLHRR